MTFILAISILLSVLLVWFVTTPLIAAENMDVFSSSYKGFSDEAELRQLLDLRDKLLSRLVSGKSSDERVSQLSEQDCVDALISMCLRLQRAELPYLPTSFATGQIGSSSNLNFEEKGQKGSANLSALFFALIVGVAAICATHSRAARAEDLPKGQASAQASTSTEQQRAPSSTVVPALAPIEPDVFVPQANRFMVSPAQGEMMVHYLTSFSIPAKVSNGLTVVMAVPERLYDWQVVAVRPESLAQQLTVVNWHGVPALQLPSGTQGLAVELTAEFKMNAFAGSVQWNNSRLPSHPGEQFVVLFEVPGILKSVFGEAAEGWNIWPPRIGKVGENLNLAKREIAMNPNLPARKVQILSRKSSDPQPYLNFEVVGLAPNRLPLIVLGALVAAILFGVALFVFTRGLRWRIDSPETLPG